MLTKMNSHTSNETITLTFCDSGENHVGMEMLGEKVEVGDGFQLEDLIKTREKFEELGLETELYNLGELVDEEKEEAYVLVIRSTVSKLVNKEELWNELTRFEWDRKYYCTRRKRVLNKHARANVCFAEVGRVSDYERKRGTIIGYTNVPQLALLRKTIEIGVGDKGSNMVCEGNRYFKESCGIGFHGDSERRRVIGVRLGLSMPIHWCWYKNSKAIGKKLELMLNDGDMYMMSEKAVGTDWKKRKIATLRHAAGHVKYLVEKR